jgi:DNA-binding MarR family transcriptional regulator
MFLPTVDDDFTELEGSAWGGLLGMHARMMRAIEADLQARAGISHAEFEVLLRLNWAEGRRLRLQDLEARTIMSRSGISRIVERLEKSGLLTRETAPEDRRGSYAVLTRKGRTEFAKALRAHVALVRRDFLTLYSERELQQMAAFWLKQKARVASGL